MNYYLDTNICVPFLRGWRFDLLRIFLSHDLDAIKIPAMVSAELVYGAYKSANPEKSMRQVERFLEMFEIVPFDALAAIHYGKIRAALEKQGQTIGPNDLVIAALVMSQSGILVTNNTREFSRIKDIPLEDWTA